MRAIFRPMSMLPALLAPAFSILASFGLNLGPSFGFSSQTEPDGTAYLTIKADGESLDGIEIEVSGDNGFHLTKTVSVRKGASKKITWKQKGKNVSYELKLSHGDSQTDFNFDVMRPQIGGQPVLEMHATAQDIVEKRQSNYRTRFMNSSQHFEVYSTGGELIMDENSNVSYDVGADINYSWNSCDDVFMVRLTATDDGGRQAIQTNVVWKVDVPHTDVNFDSGKWDIKKSEEPKLDEAFAIMANELAGLDRASEVAKQKVGAQLYIVGYTDSVGNGGDNLKLSQNRAKAIAKYFVDKGLWCEVFYAGMGEKGQRIKTDDSVDEVRNRRALYLFETHKPAPGGQVPSTGSWRKISEAHPRMMNKLPDLPESYVEHKAKMRAKQTGGACGVGMVSTSTNGDGSPAEGGAVGQPHSDTVTSAVEGGTEYSGSNYEGGGEGAGGGADGPEPIGETPATKQGCAVDNEAAPTGLLALFGIAWFGRRRRRN